jgi:hypothetical protein
MGLTKAAYMIMRQATSIQSKSRQQGAVRYSEHTLKERRSNGKKGNVSQSPPTEDTAQSG